MANSLCQQSAAMAQSPEVDIKLPAQTPTSTSYQPLQHDCTEMWQEQGQMMKSWTMPRQLPTGRQLGRI